MTSKALSPPGGVAQPRRRHLCEGHSPKALGTAATRSLALPTATTRGAHPLAGNVSQQLPAVRGTKGSGCFPTVQTRVRRSVPLWSERQSYIDVGATCTPGSARAREHGGRSADGEAGPRSQELSVRPRGPGRPGAALGEGTRLTRRCAVLVFRLHGAHARTLTFCGLASMSMH